MRNKRLIVLLSVVTALVLVIIVCGATFLVRDIEAYSYYVDSPVEYEKKVISASGIEKNSSMFFIDEVGVKNRIEKKYPNVEVINIERKFPDRVSINYVVYDELYQYLSGDSYYRCCASGRVASKLSAASTRCFIVRPRAATNDKVGAYFQKSNGYDRKILDKFINYMHSARINDKQMSKWIKSIDLTRGDEFLDYVYIRTAEGCAIELFASPDELLSEFTTLLDYGWSAFVDPSPDISVNPSGGKIQVYVTHASSDGAKIKMTYNEDYGDNDYLHDYMSA